MMRSIHIPAGVLLLTLVTGVQAQKAGDNVYGFGIANIAPNISLGQLTSTGPAAAPFNAATAGATASSKAVNTLSLSWLHMFTDNLATEVSIGIPPKLDLDVRLASGNRPSAASARILTPAVVGKYLFNSPSDQWRPYLGLGVTYASFRNVSANTSDPLVNQLGGGGASLSSSLAPIYNAGVIYNIDQRWSINGSISYIPLSADATFSGAGAGTGTTTRGRLKLNPTDIVIRVGYKF